MVTRETTRLLPSNSALFILYGNGSFSDPLAKILGVYTQLFLHNKIQFSFHFPHCYAIVCLILESTFQVSMVAQLVAYLIVVQVAWV
jgi:hypothetical protein